MNTTLHYKYLTSLIVNCLNITNRCKYYVVHNFHQEYSMKYIKKSFFNPANIV